MTSTMTATQASTFTEARARAVMRHVHSDFMNWASAGFIAREKAQTWFEELEYAVVHNVVDTFQIQLTKSDGTRIGLSYSVRDDGTILEESKAGGFDPYGLPSGTTFGLCLTYRQGVPNLESVRAYLRERGWGPGGSLLGGGARDRAYSKNGLGIERSKVGEW
jgi:hypothetical protein